ncbi:MAG: hypothetical protein ACRENL_05650, partial [Candidatus Dormibacteria bacterium]
MSAARCARQAAAWAGPYAHAVQVASQADIDAHSAGTRYALAVGTHNLSLVPKSGDSIVGLGAATVLNGGASTAHGISDGGGTVTNVTIRNLEVNNYAPSFQKGSIDVSGSGSTGWTVVNVTAITSTGRGISGDSGGMLAYGGRYSGHAGVAAGNVRLLYACELDHSGTHGQEGNEAGGTKWAVRNPTTVQSCWIHDNIGVGVWSDINAFDITVI